MVWKIAIIIALISNYDLKMADSKLLLVFTIYKMCVVCDIPSILLQIG